MIRYSLLVFTVLATAATAIAAVVPREDSLEATGRNVTVIEKNQAFPIHGPVIVEECAMEDCSDVAS